MCELCQGKRVVRSFENYGIGFAPCPNCPPETEQERMVRLAPLYERLDAYREEGSTIGC